MWHINDTISNLMLYFLSKIFFIGQYSTINWSRTLRRLKAFLFPFFKAVKTSKRLVQTAQLIGILNPMKRCYSNNFTIFLYINALKTQNAYVLLTAQFMPGLRLAAVLALLNCWVLLFKVDFPNHDFLQSV